MRKQLIHRAVITLLLGCIMLLAFTGCGKSNEKRNVSGSYHTEANGYKRGTDVDINLEGDKITPNRIFREWFFRIDRKK